MLQARMGMSWRGTANEGRQKRNRLERGCHEYPQMRHGPRALARPGKPPGLRFLRPREISYVSLETKLSEAGVIITPGNSSLSK